MTQQSHCWAYTLRKPWLRKTHVPQCSLYTIYNSQSIDEWMDKEAVVHMHSGIVLSHKKEWIWVTSSEVDEPVIQNEVSQKKKNKYYILMHAYGI